MKPKVILYALSTCGWCQRVKALLDAKGVFFKAIDVDLLDGEERKQAREKLLKLNKRGSYPTTVINDKEVVIGYDESRLRELIEPCLKAMQKH